MKEIVKKWLDRVEYDIQTAEAMLDAGRTIYGVFMCQQALEKCFKALIEHRGEEPYPIHNLRRLSALCKARFDEEGMVKLDFLSQYYINARYKDDVAELARGITKEMVSGFITFSKETIEWLKREMK
jgi:HEPN domain-containing protein